MILKTSRPYHYLLGSIKWQLLTVILLAIGIAEVEDYIIQTFGFEFPIAIPAFLGTAIVFILAFRTNQAYDRWWEARKVWGAIVNDSRSWTRMVINLINDEPADVRDGVELKRRLINRQIAWNYILTNRLREQPPLEGMEPYFVPKDFAFIEKVDNPNQAILILQSEDLKIALDSGRLHGLHHIEMEECARALEASMGKVERIKNTHFPVLYDHMILFSIYIFAVLLCYAIRDETIWFEVIFTILISAIFLALEKIASDMQDPFENLPTDTPMTAISNVIERGALQMVGETEMPPDPEQGRFYIN